MDTITRLVLTSSFISFLFIFASLWTSSLVLLSEGIHNLSDAFSYVVAWTIEKKSQERAEPHKPWGSHRIQPLGGFFSGCFLLCSALFVLLEALERLFSKEASSASAWYTITLGLVELSLNGIVVFFHSKNPEFHHYHSHGQSNAVSPRTEILRLHAVNDEDDLEISFGDDECNSSSHSHSHNHNHSHHHGFGGHSHTNLNLKGAITHALSDVSTALIVITSGFISLSSSSHATVYIDCIASACIIIVVLYMTRSLLQETASILLLETPPHVPLDHIHSELIRMENVRELSLLRIFPIASSRDLAATVHLRASSGSDTNEVAQEVTRLLQKQYHIDDVTIQTSY